ncbi:MAG TPA: hypothetical protein VGZ02_15100 [Candidatus Baltobacteraceae bacterium]|jgi:hypothetical protein|nr:hypothetical protein [Candidatus Baltobacteraceae bacterium]
MFAALLLAALSSYSFSVPVVQQTPPLDGAFDPSAWKNAATLQLGWDLQGHKSAPDKTAAYVETDGTNLYVAFDAKQSGAVVATQHTNNAGLGTDDDVSVYLWPGGSDGFRYQFTANPAGTHYQFSSENSSYEPVWYSHGRIAADGYQVVMKIPLAIMRGAQAGKPWLIQLSRTVENTGDLLVWAYDSNEQQPSSSVYAGSMDGMKTIAAARLKPRVGLYTLGSIAGSSIGGSTSRNGVDLSIPYTPTSSFYATVHPDYSNVELDQQSISPTAFRRYYQEVRPFFTQGQQAYDNFNCDLCQGINTLYTPAIPTPRDGYAVEGTQGPINYGAFDAVGDGRNDTAQALTYQNHSKTISASIQRVGVNLPGFADDSLETGLAWGDNKHLFAYGNYGTDSGTNVVDARRAQMYDFGAGWSDPTTTFATTYRKVGEYFNPADGFVWHPDIAGYGAYFAHAFIMPDNKPIRSVTFTSIIDSYHDHTGALDQTDQGANLDILTKGRIDVSISGIGSDFLRLSNGDFVSVSQNQYAVTFGSGAQNTSVNNGAQHGSSATPTTLSLTQGRFGYGHLNYWSLSTTQHALRNGLVSFEVDESNQNMDSGLTYRQWLERVSYTYQSGPNSSLALGVRRIIGVSPVLVLPAPGQSAPFTSAWNLSAAYHRTFDGSNELYAVYGDASALSTAPQFIVKWLHYFGAAKGT